MGIRLYKNPIAITGLSDSGTTTDTGSWNTSINLASIVASAGEVIPSGATAVIIGIENATSLGTRWIGARSTGKTTPVILSDWGVRSYLETVVPFFDVLNSIDLYTESASTTNIHIKGFCDGQFTWFDPDIAKPTLASTGSSWKADISSPTDYRSNWGLLPSDTVALVFSTFVGNWTPFGVTASYPGNLGGLQVIPVSGASKTFRANTFSINTLTGVVRGGVAFDTWRGGTPSPESVALTADSAWHTVNGKYIDKVIHYLHGEVNGDNSGVHVKEVGSTWQPFASNAGSGSQLNRGRFGKSDENGDYQVWYSNTSTNSQVLYVNAIFDTYSVSTGITSVGEDNTIADGDTGITVIGTGLNSVSGVRLSSTNTSEVANLSVTSVTVSSLLIEDINYGAGVPYTDDNHNITLGVIVGGISVASVAVTFNPPEGFIVLPILEEDINRTEGMSALYDLPIVPVNSQVKVPTSITVAGSTYSIEYEKSDAGNWTGGIAVTGFEVSSSISITGAEYLLAGGTWEPLTIVLATEESVPVIGTVSGALRHTSNKVIPVTGAGASQGSGSVTLGGVVQSIVSWSDTSITINVNRGNSKYGVSLPLVVTNGLGEVSNPVTVPLEAPTTHTVVNLTTPAGSGLLITPESVPAATGWQIAYRVTGGTGTITVNPNWTGTVPGTVTQYQYELHNGSSWESVKTVNIGSASFIPKRKHNMRILKLATIRDIVVRLVSSSDHITPVTGATLTVTLSKNGGTFASATPNQAELGNGYYRLALSTVMTNTLGDLVVYVTAPGADPVDERCQIVAVDFTDTTSFGLTRLDAAVTTRSALQAADVQSNASAALTAFGAATATQVTNAVSGLATTALVNTVNGKVDTVVAKVTPLTFSKTNELDINLKSINGVTINGNGASPKFGP